MLWRHRRVLLNPRYGSLGLVTYPYYFFVELIAPVIEAIGLIGTVLGMAVGMLDYRFGILLFLAAYGLGAALTAATLVLEEVSFHRYDRMRDRLLLLTWTLLENFGYRQLTVLWRLRGLWSYLSGSQEWGRMERTGFTSREPASPGGGASQ